MDHIARTFLIFFDRDRTDLTFRARVLIFDAAQSAIALNASCIEISGHTELTGTPEYAQRLSLRCAENVAHEFVLRGINREALFIRGFGYTRPLVPTSLGMREAQNRRVEIVIR